MTPNHVIQPARLDAGPTGEVMLGWPGPSGPTRPAIRLDSPAPSGATRRVMREVPVGDTTAGVACHVVGFSDSSRWSESSKSS